MSIESEALGLAPMERAGLVQTLLTSLPTQEWGQLLGWVVSVEKPRRDASPAVEQAQAEVVKELQDSGKLTPPPAATEAQATEAGRAPDWQDPGTDHAAMYHEGDVVAHAGHLWVSRHPYLNSWEPGAQGVDGRIWEDITPKPAEETPTEPGTDAPAGSRAPQWAPGVQYVPGEEVTYNGASYRVQQAHTSQADWTPDAVASLYTPVVN